MLALCLFMPADAKKPKEQALLFPDGTVVPEWFKTMEVPALQDLGKQYNIADYGAISDPVNVQTELIQSVIDKAAAEGGGVIIIPEGIYKSGALFFRQVPIFTFFVVPFFWAVTLFLIFLFWRRHV